MKLFTIDHRFVIRKSGRIAARDASSVEAVLAAAPAALVLPKSAHVGKA